MGALKLKMLKLLSHSDVHVLWSNLYGSFKSTLSYLDQVQNPVLIKNAADDDKI